MRSYLSLFKIRLINSLQYRVAALAGMSTQFFFGLIMIMVYIAFYESNPNQKLPINIRQVVNYIWLGQIFFAAMYYSEYDHEIGKLITKGDICYELVRPQNIYWKWFTQLFSKRFSYILLRSIPTFILLTLIPLNESIGFSLNPEMIIIVEFITSLILALILIVSLNLIIHIFIYFLMDSKGILNFMMVIGSLFSGSLIPLPLLPKIFQMIASYLPFKYFHDFPFGILIGTVSRNQIYIGYFIQIFWIFVVLFLGYKLMKVALKRIVVQGG